KPSPAVQDLAIQFYIRHGEFAHAYDLRTRYDRPQLDRSVIEAELAFKREPNRTELPPQMIRDLVRAGRFKEAVELEKQGQTPFFDLGKAYWMVGRKDEAIAAYRRASSGLVYKLPAEIALAAMTGDIAHWREAFRAERPIQDLFILSQL